MASPPDDMRLRPLFDSYARPLIPTHRTLRGACDEGIGRGTSCGSTIGMNAAAHVARSLMPQILAILALGHTRTTSARGELKYPLY